MLTEHTHLKNASQAGDSNATDETDVIGKSNTYQRPLLIIAGSLLAFLVLIVAAGTSGGQHLQSSAHEIVKGAVALTENQVDSTNVALSKDIFGLVDVEGWKCFDGDCVCCSPGCYSTGCITKVCDFFNYDCNGACCDNVFCTVGCRNYHTKKIS